jgi:hypothetical protein
MKLEELEIHNFRGIRDLKLSFLDELDRIRRVFPIVGPNTSGKTSILDAIHLCLGPLTRLFALREGVPVTPAALVRRGAAQAEAKCTVSFSKQEMASARTLAAQIGQQAIVPDVSRFEVYWNYPSMYHHPSIGGVGHHKVVPDIDKDLPFIARALTNDWLHVPAVSPRDYEERGGVFLFDQQRTGLVTHIDPATHALLSAGPPTELVTDPRLILLNLATRAQAKQDPKATEHEDYARVCDLYARICHPHRIRGLYNTEHGLDMEFEGDHERVYRYDGLSSGQQMILLLVLQFATRHIHRSIVLIDELELHLHPLWQSRLYHSLEDLGVDNQYIFTTHSTHLRGLLQDQFVATGDLDEEG